MSYFFVLLTGVTEPHVTFVLFVRQERSARVATPLTFAHRFPIRCASPVFRETRGVSKVPMAVVTGDSNPANAHGGLTMQLLHVLVRHGTGKFRY